MATEREMAGMRVIEAWIEIVKHQEGEIVRLQRIVNTRERLSEQNDGPGGGE